MGRVFPGGRHWPQGLFLYYRPFETISRPPYLTLPLWHGGQAYVSEGQRIKPFQAIGCDRQGLPVHSGLGGRVSRVGDFPHLLARPQKFDFPRLSVTIEVDHQQEETAFPYQPRPRFWELTHQELCRRLWEAGVMDVCHQDLPRMVIYNALDLEPPLSANHRLLEERTARIITGMQILNQLHGTVRSRLVLARGFPKLEARLRAMLASSVNLSLHLVDPVYPQGHRALLAKEIFSQDRCSIYDMSEVLRVEEAVVRGRPVVDSCLTAVSSRGLRRNVVVPIGTPAGVVLGAGLQGSDGPGVKSGGDGARVSSPETTATLSLVFGGLVSGRSFYSLEMPVTAETKGLLLWEAESTKAGPCFNCGRCYRICPVGLHPLEIYYQTKRGDKIRLKALGIERCLDCGLCSWSCPARIELYQQLEVGRQILAGRL